MGHRVEEKRSKWRSMPGASDSISLNWINSSEQPRRCIADRLTTVYMAGESMQNGGALNLCAGPGPVIERVCQAYRRSCISVQLPETQFADASSWP